MGHSTHRAHGVPATRGPLRTYRTCPDCTGSGWRTISLEIGPHGADQLSEPCPTCDGQGRVLVRSQSMTAATQAAKSVIRSGQGRGRPGRDM